MSALPEALAGAGAALVSIKVLFQHLDEILKDKDADTVRKRQVEQWWTEHQSVDLRKAISFAGKRAHKRLKAVSFTRRIVFGLKLVLIAVVTGSVVEIWHLRLGNVSVSMLDEAVLGFLVIALGIGLPAFLMLTLVAQIQLLVLSQGHRRSVLLFFPIGIIAMYVSAWVLRFPAALFWIDGTEAIHAWLWTVGEIGSVLAAATATMHQLLLLVVVISPVLMAIMLAALVTVARLDSRFGSPVWRFADRIMFRWSTENGILSTVGSVCGGVAAGFVAVAKLF